ncbi:MAG TPA: hypothetical protein VH917_06950, partial [Ignavibacteriaceae bacterium]
MNKSSLKNFPLHGWVGLSFIIIFWYLNWELNGLRTHILFFPLWLGYTLTIDAIVFLRKGKSLLTRNKKKFILLFFISAPAWWLFEILNLRTQNWYYDGKQFFTDVEYAVYATLSFSTVIPSVFVTAELMSSFKIAEKFKFKSGFILKDWITISIFIAGLIMLALLIIFPEYFFVFMWMSLLFLLDPINFYLKNPSLIKFVSTGNWKPVISLTIGCLLCGFFWELWNYYSYPKWVYDVPF